jgi:hypothetical protein
MTNQFQMQPAFQVRLPVGVEEAKRRIRSAITSDELAGLAESAGMVVDYKIEPQNQRFWSPHLSIQLNRLEAEESSSGPDRTEAFCRFSPRPEIWTMVMAIYMVASCCSLAAIVYGGVQLALKETPWAFVVLPIGMAVIAGLHTASLIGQRLSRDQMQLLRSRWDRTVELAFADLATTDIDSQPEPQPV